MRSLSLLGLCVFLACGPEPVFDDDLGVTPVSTAPGALAGTFGMKSVTINLADLPLIGEQLAGSQTHYLITRTWDGEAYSFSHKICGGEIYDTVGGSTFMEENTWRQMRPVGAPEIALDHGTGIYSVERYVDLFGYDDLDDPYEDPFPADADEAAEDPRVIDADGDGNPGVTSFIEGVATGEVYLVQRRQGGFRGAVLSEDRLVGINSFGRNQTIIGSTNDLLLGKLVQRTHPDPLESWFEERRLEDGADCDDVNAAVESELLPRLRAFGLER